MSKRTPEAIETLRQLAPKRTAVEIARVLGITSPTVRIWATAANIPLMSLSEAVRRSYATNPSYTDKCRKNMARINANPVLVAKKSARLRALHADPVWAAAHAQRASALMKALHADPTFAAANLERAKKTFGALNSDPRHQKKARIARRRNAVEVPGWVPPTFVRRYRALTRKFGEEHAAAEARRLKRQQAQTG